MGNNVLYSSFLIALAGACGGCASQPPEMTPVGKAIVRVRADQNPTPATVQLANEVVIFLPPPLAGHEWQIIQHNALALRQLTNFGPSPEGTGEVAISFMAVRAAPSRLMFALIPTPNPAGAAPADVREIQLVVE